MQSTVVKTLFISLALTSVGTAQAVSKKVLDQRLQAVESEQSTVLERVDKLERSTSTEVMVELLQKVEQLQAENAELRGQVEEQRNAVERLRKRQRDLYLDMDRRLNDMQMSSQSTPQFAEGAAAISAASAATAATVAADSAKKTTQKPKQSQKPAADSAKERAEYEKAFNYLREGRHSDSIKAFNKYLKKSPNGRYADNAQYWIGEAHYVTRKFDKALVDFQKVLDQYPSSNKVPDASLKLGYTYYELKKFGKAREVLAKVAKQFPTTKAASLAEKRLLSMSKDGL